MTYLVYTTKGLLLFHENHHYFHLKDFFCFNLLNIRWISFKFKYIEVVKEDYQTQPSEFDFNDQYVNWACKIICPSAINYWERWDVTFPNFGLFGNFKIPPVLKFLNSTAFYEKECLTIKYDLKDAILICHRIESIMLSMYLDHQEYKIGVQINDKFWDDFKQIDLFIELIKTSEVKVFGCYEHHQTLICFNKTPLF